MEFEKDTAVSEEQRLLAQTKRATIQPLNPFLKPEDTPNPIVTNETHSNVAQDTENTALPTNIVQPSRGILNTELNTPGHHSFKILLVSFSLVAGIAAGAGAFVFFG